MAMPTPLEIYLLTFNCARTLIEPQLLGAHLFNAWPKHKTTLPDIVAFSLQEVTPIAYSFLGEAWIQPYLARVDESLSVASATHQNASSQYERVAAHSIGMTAAMVYVRKELKESISKVETAGVGVGVWEMGNKGGVGIRFDIDGKELTFLAMHLAPMEGCVIRRNQDWEDICRGLVFEQAGQGIGQAGTEQEPLLAGMKRTATGLYKKNNTIFLFGDLNYRTSHLPPGPSTYKTYPQPARPDDPPNTRIAVSDLLARDELTQERLEGRVLQGFAEEPITFPPTYKYSHSQTQLPGPQAAKEDSTDESDDSTLTREPSTWTWAKHRWPSWCDRILFYPPNGITPGTYTALPLLPSSDHRAVALHVTLDLSAHDGVDGDLRVSPPFPLDLGWRTRRAAARRYEVAVGMASWPILTTEGNATLGGLLASALAVYFLFTMFGRGV